MSSVSGTSSSSLRIGGLASGMDTDSIVKQLMAAQRIPLDKLNQSKQVLQWTRDSYKDINSKMIDFRTNKLYNYRVSSTMNTQSAVVTGDTAALQATASSTANGIPLTVTVNSVATKAATQSAAGINVTTTNTDGSTTTKTASLNTTVKQLANLPDSDTSKYGMKINGVAIGNITKDDTISSIISKINSAKDADGNSANVTATFDEISGKISITSKSFGTDGKVDITDDGTNLSLKDLLGGFKPTVPGNQASITVKTDSGSQTYDKLNTNTLTVNGITLVATAITADPTKPTVITTQTDPTKSIDTIKAFVQNYNDLLDKLNTKTDEQKYRDYAPLTDEQKKAMSDDDIKAWNEKAQSGLLRNDDILKAAVSSMRSAITKAIGNAGLSLTDVGITTGQWYEGGKLYLDENKLKTAVQNNPQGVTELFQGSATDPGLFSNLMDGMDDAIGKISKKAGTSKISASLTATYNEQSVMGKQLKDYTTRITNLTSRLDDMEKRYYAQFTAMEQSISKFNSQSTSLTGLLSGK